MFARKTFQTHENIFSNACTHARTHASCQDNESIIPQQTLHGTHTE